MATLLPTKLNTTSTVATGSRLRFRIARLTPLWMLLPSLVILLVIQVYPTLYSIYLSLNRIKGSQMTWVGLRNYERLLADSRFIDSLTVSFKFVSIYVVVTLALSMLIAILLNQRAKFNSIYLVLLFVPWVISDVVGGTIFRWLFQQDYGLVQSWVNPFVNNVTMYSNPSGALAIVLIASVWRSLAFTSLLFLAALQNIPNEILESAALDGADRVSMFTRIIFPMISATFVVAMILTTIGGLNSVGLMQTLTGGGPGGATTTAGVYLYQVGWKFGDFGLGAATSVILFLINLVLTLAFLRLQSNDG
jgi:ABC-type sugar transport system permease subunit